MARVLSYGAYLPRHRLTAGSLGRKGATARTLAGADEDSLTLAVAAARNALKDGDVDRLSIDGLIFATATSPYGEKQCSAIAARALGLRPDAVTLDVLASTRAATQAVYTAAALVDSRRVSRVLVVTGDVRQVAPGDAAELSFGDAGAALVLAVDEGFAEFSSIVQQSNEMIDVWRASSERFVHGWESRFILDHGYKEQVRAALRALAQAPDGDFGQIARAAVYAPDLRSLKELGSAAGLPTEKVVGANWFGRIGCTGSSFALLQLCGAFEEANAGERLLLANYGDGVDAAIVNVIGDPVRPSYPIAQQLGQGKEVDYAWYLNARNLLPKEFDGTGDLGNSATAHFRERDANLGFEGQVCACGTHQFPKGRVCVRCGAVDRFQPRRYADQTGRVVTYSHDYFFPSPSPPTPIAITEVNGGPRIYLQVADAETADIDVDTEVEFVFRRIHQVGNRPNYFWKCTPLRGDGK